MDILLDTEKTRQLRIEMVEDQLEYRGIHDPDILEAFRAIPRHLFIPNISVNRAYGDNPLPINAGQTISQPFIVALMLWYLDIKPHHQILEIGSGSGYATAILSKLCMHIDAVEVYGTLIDASSDVLKRLSLTNISLLHKSAWEQMDSSRVYDRIILWASPPRVPDHLFDNLADGGIMVAPEGKTEQYIWIYKKVVGKIEKIKKDAVRFVPLVRGSVMEIDGLMRGNNG